MVEITGTNFTAVASVTIGGQATAYAVASLTRLTATVPAAARSGRIGVTTASGTATSADDFVVAAPDDRFAAGMVTLSFDDSVTPQFTNARPILNHAGVKASFNVVISAVDGWGMSLADVVQLGADGHEIASHTMTHADLPTLGLPQLDDELASSRQWLLDHTGVSSVTTLAYPYGTYGPTVKAEAARFYAGARGFTGDHPADTVSGPDVHRNLRSTDRYALGSYPTGARYGTEEAQLTNVKAQIDAAIAECSWLILVFHSVQDQPGDYDVTPAFLQRVLDYLATTGVPVVTTAEGLRRM